MSDENVEDRDLRDKLRQEMEQALKSGAGPKIARFALACIGGAIPFVGGAVSGAASSWSEAEQARFNRVFATWLKLQEDELKEIGVTLMEVLTRLDTHDPDVQKRVESPEYLSIVKKCFRDWSAAESEEKRRFVRNILIAAAATRMCPDDVVKLFIQWIGEYSEAHFKVIQVIDKNPGSTRKAIWMKIHGQTVREDSAEADLFKRIVHDLSTGRLIRQHREKDQFGNFRQQRRPRPRPTATRVMKSAFDEADPYELTELGKQFVHYAMTENAPRLAAASEAAKT